MDVGGGGWRPGCDPGNVRVAVGKELLVPLLHFRSESRLGTGWACHGAKLEIKNGFRNKDMTYVGQGRVRSEQGGKKNTHYYLNVVLMADNTWLGAIGDCFVTWVGCTNHELANVRCAAVLDPVSGKRPA